MAADTRSASFTQTLVEPLAAWRKSQQVDLHSFFANDVTSKLASLKAQTKKAHRTPGYFLHAVRLALQSVGCPNSTAAQKDWGGFRDVGNHTNCAQPATVTALVLGCLRHVVRMIVEVCRCPSWQTDEPALAWAGPAAWFCLQMC